ncbi:MAG: CAP domain-containing protein [Bacteroidales bacterium]|nr:CAP domain-containing protein [Bacteroidales bacterium]
MKILLIVIVVLICLPRSILPLKTSDQRDNDISTLIKLNESEKRLTEFKDDEKALKMKLIQLEIINNSRKRYKAPPVKLDIFASRVANKICKEAAENNFVGHWNTDGEKPYQRYAFAGGYDHVTENAFGIWSSENYVASSSNISSMMKKGHSTFMAERAPYDGHKKTIINKTHNFVGIGYYLSGKQFRYYEEFVDRYLEFKDIPEEARTDEPVKITVNTNGENFLYYLIAYREKFPEPIAPSRISKLGSYEDFTSEEYLKVPAWDLARYRNGNTYNIPLKFSKEGLYYIIIYIDEKEYSGATSLSTKGKTAASGIVIRVNK